MISFIIPAHNEEALLGRTLQAVHDSARAVGEAYEIIVVNDASTDRTAEIARQNRARVLDVNHRQIAATRNSGARAARGDRLFFVDADTIINPKVLALALRHMAKGAAGGGALARFDKGAPLYAQLLIWWLGLFMRLVGICGGAFMFCKREAFISVGGFDERLFGAEDAALSWSLKREGRFVVLWPTVLTSPRRVRGINGLRAVKMLIQAAWYPGMLRERSRVQKIWYESKREPSEPPPDTLPVKLLNGAAFIFMTVVLTGPIWIFPWPQEFLKGPVATFRFISGVVGLHVGLLLWPCLFF